MMQRYTGEPVGHPQGLLVFPLFVLFRLLDILGQNDLLGNLIKLSPENPRSIEN